MGYSNSRHLVFNDSLIKSPLYHLFHLRILALSIHGLENQYDMLNYQ